MPSTEVRPVAERLVAVRERMRELERTQGELVTAIGGNGGGYAAGDLNEAQTELVGLADAAVACVDTARRAGRAGQGPRRSACSTSPPCATGPRSSSAGRSARTPSTYWHGIGEGFAGRKPIDWDE